MSDSAAPIKLFEKKERIFPKRVWGKYRKVKWVVMVITLAIYYLAPFLRWDRGLHAPDQAILIDMPARRAYFFFIEIWPQEVYYLTGILILAAVALFFVTSLFGRVWCGYACPQTVWTDLFVWVERIVQGDRAARMKLKKAPWTLGKIWKMLVTHSLWLLIGLLTGGAWVFYFNDAPTLLEHILHLDVPMSVLGWIMALTFSTYLMAGFAREQVCMYMCPYSRFQSAMFDKDTLIITYDEDRGEKRGKHKKGESWEGRGHCIDCTACVQVCPMGIDIRDGLQMECIACGLCVDACNNIMDKVDLPRGLIRYDTTHNQEQRRSGLIEKTVQTHLLRPRTFWYMAILAVVGSVMLYSLINRAPVDLHVLHDRNPLFVPLSDGTVRNGYNVKILNKSYDDKYFRLSVEGLEGATIRAQGAGDVQVDNLHVFADSVGHFRVFVTAPKQKPARQNFRFIIEEVGATGNEAGETVAVDSHFASRRQ
ncbi:cytochrome c oxidase accessory protein CcoG [Kordiimonas lipolytica]|uniref:Cytochrome c oxidase accessory protein CcoG n=1 Tax=Kordiimonas lipolytica TaxID=1662421 RepID=A0ABV8UDZ2_9PROT|nr:cytochrome c oxidase accessory protein CcoG [Kordiimonas lipolytica]